MLEQLLTLGRSAVASAQVVDLGNMSGHVAISTYQSRGRHPLPEMMGVNHGLFYRQLKT